MIAAVIIAGGKRSQLIDERIVPSVADFDEVLVVGLHHYANDRYRYLNVADLTSTTNDALVKRDVGTLACRSDVVLYLSDDHCVTPDFGTTLREEVKNGYSPWDVLVPSRWAQHPEHGLVRIPNGEAQLYCGGHGGVFRRRVIMDRPWSAHKHHRNWDLIASHEQQQAGFRFLGFPKLGIMDLEPDAQPWL